MAADLDQNRDLILGEERRLAGHIAREVVDRPVLTVWMILIPVFFVFYFFQLKRYKSGLRNFSSNFLRTRRLVLDAVHAAERGRGSIDTGELVAVSDSPAEVKEEYREWVLALAEHYQALIRAEGVDYEELVVGAYRKKTNYRLALTKLTRTEDVFNRALCTHIEGDAQSIASVVEAMQKSIGEARRARAAEIFS